MQTISNREYYEGIKDKAVIIYDKGQNTEELSKTKTVILRCRDGYAHSDYLVLSNMWELEEFELALICDGGNLCFGYRASGNMISVYND